MELSRSEYPAVLVCAFIPCKFSTTDYALIDILLQGTVQPGQAITILEDRVRSIGKINSDIAEWLSVCYLRLD